MFSSVMFSDNSHSPHRFATYAPCLAVGVVTVEGEGGGRDHPGDLGQHGRHGAGGAHPDGVAQRDLIAAHVMECLGHHRHLGRGYLSFIWAAHHTGHIT